jgi:uncharacterized protein (DUF2141 family)
MPALTLIPIKPFDNMKCFTFSALIAVNFIFMYSCKSPEVKKSPVVISKDSTIVVADTTTIPAGSDTVATAKAPLPLTLVITNLASATGPVIVGVYGTKNKFPDPRDQLKVYKFTPHDKQLTAQITDLPAGTYAMAIFQDVNSNGKIDKNLIGIPTEPYAFSKNYKPTVKAPAFKDCCFDYLAQNDTINMKMIR